MTVSPLTSLSTSSSSLAPFWESEELEALVSVDFSNDFFDNSSDLRRTISERNAPRMEGDNRGYVLALETEESE